MDKVRIGYVDYDGGWGTTKPEGCFESDWNGRIHFNRGSGGNFVGTDKILCGNKIFIFFIICLLDMTLHNYKKLICYYRFIFLQTTTTTVVVSCIAIVFLDYILGEIILL